MRLDFQVLIMMRGVNCLRSVCNLSYVTLSLIECMCVHGTAIPRPKSTKAGLPGGTEFKLSVIICGNWMCCCTKRNSKVHGWLEISSKQCTVCWRLCSKQWHFLELWLSLRTCKWILLLGMWVPVQSCCALSKMALSVNIASFLVDLAVLPTHEHSLLPGRPSSFTHQCQHVNIASSFLVDLAVLPTSVNTWT